MITFIYLILRPLTWIVLFSAMNVQILMAETQIISKNINGGTGNGDSFSPRSTPDGRYIVFASDASDLVHDDNNHFPDIFLYDKQEKTTERISLGLNGKESNGFSILPSISDDGRYIVFQSSALNLVADDLYDDTQPENYYFYYPVFNRVII